MKRLSTLIIALAVLLFACSYADAQKKREYYDAQTFGYQGHVKNVVNDGDILLSFNQDGSIAKFYEYEIKNPEGKTPIPSEDVEQFVEISREENGMISCITRGDGFEGDEYRFFYNDDHFTISQWQSTFLGGAFASVQFFWENGKLVKAINEGGCEGEETITLEKTEFKYDSHNNFLEDDDRIEYWE